jgi:hypothetical protein
MLFAVFAPAGALLGGKAKGYELFAEAWKGLVSLDPNIKTMLIFKVNFPINLSLS